MPNFKFINLGIDIKSKDKRLYQIWIDLRRRCNSKKYKDYKNYGYRGIKVYDKWGDFITFYNWAMDNGYSDDLTIDRIDVNGNYEPSNCRWITNAKQQRNRRNNKLITFNNSTHCLSEWAEIMGISTACLWYRINKWELNEAMTRQKKAR